MVKFGWDKLKRFLAQAQTWTGVQTFASLVATTADINAGTFDGIVGGTTPAAVTASPLKSKGPAAITSFAGTVSTSGASTTITWSSAADAILAGYNATNPTLGTTIITGAIKQASVTRYVVSWTNATACVVDSACTLAAATELTSVQLPINMFVNSAGVVQGWMNAAGDIYAVGDISALTASVGTTQKYKIRQSTIAGDAQGGSMIDSTSGGDLLAWTSGITKIQIGGNANIGFNTVTFGTSADKVLAIGAGTMPTALVADAIQMGVAEYNSGTGDVRLNIYGEATVAAKTAIGSGKVSINGAVTSGGGFTRQLAEAASAALSGATGSIAVNVPSGSRILGVQLRVDTAITSDDVTKTWAATYVNTPTTAITSGRAFGANTKFDAVHPAYEITTGTVTITITAAAGLFTAGVVRAIVYYEAIDAMASL
jgi:hypothetical protein